MPSHLDFSKRSVRPVSFHIELQVCCRLSVVFGKQYVLGQIRFSRKHVHSRHSVEVLMRPLDLKKIRMITKPRQMAAQQIIQYFSKNCFNLWLDFLPQKWITFVLGFQQFRHSWLLFHT